MFLLWTYNLDYLFFKYCIVLIQPLAAILNKSTVLFSHFPALQFCAAFSCLAFQSPRLGFPRYDVRHRVT